MKKEEEIAKLLSQGTPPVELIQRGFARGTVYKVRRSLAQERTPIPRGPNKTISGTDNFYADLTLESDPEILEKKKAVLMAELDRRLAEVRAPIDFEDRLAKIESEFLDFFERLTALHYKLDGSPLAGIRHRFKCSCGAKGLVAARVCCTSCGSETSRGWYPA